MKWDVVADYGPSLRGARGTNQIVRDFWLACRGTNFAYAS